MVEKTRGERVADIIPNPSGELNKHYCISSIGERVHVPGEFWKMPRKTMGAVVKFPFLAMFKRSK